MTEKVKSKRGFASMDPEMRRAIASQGGKVAHERGLAHKFTPEEARAAVARRRELKAQRQAAQAPAQEEAAANG